MKTNYVFSAAVLQVKQIISNIAQCFHFSRLAIISVYQFAVTDHTTEQAC